MLLLKSPAPACPPIVCRRFWGAHCALRYRRAPLSRRRTLNNNNHSKRKICVVLVDRANYGRLKPVMTSIAQHPELQLQVLAAGAMVPERFAQPVKGVKKDGFPVYGA